MPVSRAELLRTFIAQRPDDPFPKYALAQELKNAGQLDEACQAFAAMLDRHADYVPAYLHAGNTLVALGRAAEARDIYRRGIEVAGRAGDTHARGELEGALALLG